MTVRPNLDLHVASMLGKTIMTIALLAHLACEK
jgi:SNF2 family DNA or RNA helicase